MTGYTRNVPSNPSRTEEAPRESHEVLTERSLEVYRDEREHTSRGDIWYFIRPSVIGSHPDMSFFFNVPSKVSLRLTSVSGQSGLSQHTEVAETEKILRSSVVPQVWLLVPRLRPKAYRKVY